MSSRKHNREVTGTTSSRRLSDRTFSCEKTSITKISTAISKDIAKSNRESVVEEAGRLFYLSIPPVLQIDSKIDQPALEAEKRLSVAGVAGAFGSDIESASDLSKSLTDHLREEELPIDHYLGN